jgi:hypothetical protein
MGNPHAFRTDRTSPEKHNRLLSYVIVEYFEVTLLKVRDALSGCRCYQNIETNASSNRTTSSRTLLRKGCSSTNEYHQSGKYALDDEHRLTSTKKPVSNSIPRSQAMYLTSVLGLVSHQLAIAQMQSTFQSTPNLLTPTIELTQTPTVRLAPDCTV